MGRLQDQVAIVTGGAQGLGGAIARGLAAEGASVLIADIDLEESEKNVEGIQAGGNTALALRTDVSRREDLQAAVERAVREWGRLDILVNNAFDVSTAGTGGAVQVSEEDWERRYERHGQGHLPGGQARGARDDQERRREHRQHLFSPRIADGSRFSGVRDGQGRGHRNDQADGL